MAGDFNLVDATLALGSNQGARLDFLREAVRRLEAVGAGIVTAASAVYENRAVGMGEAAPFLNAAVSLKTGLGPEALLDVCLGIEQELGRVRGEGWAPRTIDIDLLSFGRERLERARLTLPHPRIAERDFVLRPLMDLDPALDLAGRSVGELYGALDGVELRRTEDRLWPVPPVHLIAAVAENLVIGVDGHLPWSIPEDWDLFLRKTKGGTLVMGRVSFEDMRREPSWREDREYVVVTSRPEVVEGIEIAGACGDVAGAVERAKTGGRPVWICGGEKIYEAALPIADQFHLTEVAGRFDGDTYFPDYSEAFPRTLCSVPSCDDGNRYVFKVLGR